MSRLDWEKRNRAEMPKQKRRQNSRSKVLAAYENGARRERDRIVALVEAWLDDDQGDLRNVLNLIKTDNENTEKGQK
jgi:hypothetical protein